MPAKWQRWIPFEIDAFFGSPAVVLMDPTAQMGYWRLICSQWQTDDCTVPSDAGGLADKSGLGDERWNRFGDRILRQFQPVEGANRLRNIACFARWNEAKRVYDKRREAADRTNSSRSPSHHETVTARTPDTDTQTITNTETVKKEQKPVRTKSVRTAKPSKPTASKEPTKTDLARARHAEFKAIVGEYWKSCNAGVEMPWDGREGKNLDVFLRASPDITANQFRAFLRNRFKSEVNHSERPSAWLAWVVKFNTGPIDRFGHPVSTGGVNGKTDPSPAKQRLDGNRRALAEAVVKRGWATPEQLAGEGPATVAEPGQQRNDRGDAGGLRIVKPEILTPDRRSGDRATEDRPEPEVLSDAKRRG